MTLRRIQKWNAGLEVGLDQLKQQCSNRATKAAYMDQGSRDDRGESVQICLSFGRKRWENGWN